MPSLLAVAAVHHHLVRAGTRLRTGLVIESGEPRDIHHMATLIGYGASAINPYLMFESLDELADRSLLPDDLETEEAEVRIVKAIGKGLLKTISKMGISTIQSYCGAQIFEAVGLEHELIDKHFTGTASRIGGVGLGVLATEALERHFRAYPRTGRDLLPVGGVLQWRRDGELHIWNPDTIASLQHAVRAKAGGADRRDPQRTYDKFAHQANEESTKRAALRGLMTFRYAEQPIPLDEVEPATEIVKRFSTGAMSLGSLSREAHETLAIAMNRLGGKSNTGEGGEDPARFTADENGDLRRSAIKQVASGRFGVTIHYLVNADQLQIKMAQGAKPGEGGQLPGHKVDDYIAKIRNSTPGVGLISPPPHHDIYSIEDLKQLIYDLRCSNPEGSVSVKLVSEVGVGTVAAGVAKANADHVTISGHDGGTGASPQSSVQSAGVPWEIGLAETQQTLLLNDLRSRITVEVDGQLKTGRDVVVGALLGADEFGFSTAPLIAMGCIMMRVCHLNTCPVGIATQNPELRARFQGTPDHVTAYMMFIAEEVRGLMAKLGVRRFEDLIGRTELLEMDEAIDHWKSRGVDLSMVLSTPDLPPDVLALAHPPAGTRARRRARLGADGDVLTGARRRRAGASRAGPGAQRQPHRRRDPVRRDRPPPRRPRAARRDDRHLLLGFGRPELRRLAGPRRDLLAARRDQRLHGQGPFRRRRVGAPARRGPVPRRGEHDRRQHRALRGHRRSGLLPRAGRGALRGTQLGCPGGRRRRRRPRLRVHDRRPGGRARTDGAQLRRRDERRGGLRV